MTLTVNQIGDNPQQPGIYAETFIPDQLIAGNLKLVTGNGTLDAGTLQRGAVLGQITTTGHYILSVKTASDGSQVPSAILVDYADASAGPINVGFYLMGEFNQNAILPDASWGANAAAWTPLLSAPLRDGGIFLKPSVSAADPT